MHMMQKCKRRDLKILLTWEEATLHGWMLDLQVMTSLQKTSKQLASSVHNFIYMPIFYFPQSLHEHQNHVIIYIRFTLNNKLDALVKHTTNINKHKVIVDKNNFLHFQCIK
jgi:hypothetical protein